MGGGLRRTEEVKGLSLIERRLTLAFGDRFKLSAPVSESGDKISNLSLSGQIGKTSDRKHHQKHEAMSDVLAMLAPIDSS